MSFRSFSRWLSRKSSVSMSLSCPPTHPLPPVVGSRPATPLPPGRLRARASVGRTEPRPQEAHNLGRQVRELRDTSGSRPSPMVLGASPSPLLPQRRQRGGLHPIRTPLRISLLLHLSLTASSSPSSSAAPQFTLHLFVGNLWSLTEPLAVAALCPWC